jgi:hypothetical protein
MSQRDEDDSDNPMEHLRNEIGMGAANMMDVLTDDMAALVGDVVIAANAALIGLVDGGVESRVATGMVVGAALEGVLG